MPHSIQPDARNPSAQRLFEGARDVLVGEEGDGSHADCRVAR